MTETVRLHSRGDVLGYAIDLEIGNGVVRFLKYDRHSPKPEETPAVVMGIEISQADDFITALQYAKKKAEDET